MRRFVSFLGVVLFLLLIPAIAHAGEIQTAVATQDGSSSLVRSLSSRLAEIPNAPSGAVAGGDVQTIPVNADVQSIVFNPFNRKLYTANRRDGTVTIIDADTLQIVTTVSVTPQPIALLANPVSGNVYVGGANGFPPYVNVIHPVTYAVRQITLPPGWNVVTWARTYSFAGDTRQNKVWFGNGIGPAGDVSVIDDAGARVSSRFSVHYPDDMGFALIPQALTFNNQNNKAYVIGYRGGDARQLARLTIYNGTSFQEIRQFNPLSTAYGSGFPSSIFYNPTNNKIYAGLCGGGVVIIDGATDNIVATLPIGSCYFNFAANPDRNVVYASDFVQGNVAVIDGETDAVAGTITGISGALGLAYNKTTGNLYALAVALDQLVAIDGTTDEVVQTYPAGPFPTFITNNEGATVAVDERTGRTFFVNISGSGSGSVGVVTP